MCRTIRAISRRAPEWRAAARAPTTRPSSKLLDASRFAPCRPVRATSPAAERAELTTIRQPTLDKGRAAGELLLDRDPPSDTEAWVRFSAGGRPVCVPLAELTIARVGPPSLAERDRRRRG